MNATKSGWILVAKPQRAAPAAFGTALPLLPGSCCLLLPSFCRLFCEAFTGRVLCVRGARPAERAGSILPGEEQTFEFLRVLSGK